MCICMHVCMYVCITFVPTQGGKGEGQKEEYIFNKLGDTIVDAGKSEIRRASNKLMIQERVDTIVSSLKDGNSGRIPEFLCTLLEEFLFFLSLCCQGLQQIG